MTQMKERTAACRIGACQRHNDCMYTPCRSALAVTAPDARGTDPGHFSFVAVGKQVLIDGHQHYADACDPEAAETIVQALNERRERLTAPRRIVNYRVAPAVAS